MTNRRTNEERRRETIGKLVAATIDRLADVGYSSTSTHRICKAAGVSQGGLFNHFDTRLDLVVATTEDICRQHLERFDLAREFARQSDGDPARAIVTFVRDATRTREHAAWHEVMVAARTDAELREGIAAAVRRFEEALLATVADVLGVDGERAERLGLVLLSLMHMFDSEAVTALVYPNDAIETARVDWATELLRSELET